MATVVNEFDERPATNLHAESFGEVALSFAAICGAVGGAIGGASLGGDLGSFFPVLFGTFGTMLGSVAAGGAWCLLEKLWKATPVRVAAHRESEQPARAM